MRMKRVSSARTDPKVSDQESPEKLRVRKEQEQHAVSNRLAHSHLEERTFITNVLRDIDPHMVVSSPGAVNQLTGRGIVFVTLCSTMGFHLLRLLLRDALFGKVMIRSPNMQSALLKRRITEIYLLSTFHSLSCAAFSLFKLLRGRWDCPHGSEAMLCFSLGYTSYSLLTLRKQLFSDPMFALNELSNLTKMISCLRSRGVCWMVPLLMSSEIPLACLSILRMMAEVGTGRSSFAFRVMLGAFTTSFAAIKGVVLPAAITSLIVRRAREFPELHQPNFLPAKLALLVRVLLSYTWLGAIARHWLPHNRSSHAAQVVGAHAELPRLGELTSHLGLTWKALRTALNPLSVLYFIVLQSMYFVGPAALPAMVYALKKPKYRLAAGSGLATLAALTFWPMSFDKPFRLEPLKSAELDLAGRMVRSYFSFRSVFEEPLQKDRRYLFATLPHGVIPFAMTCLQSQLNEHGVVAQVLGASVLFRIPILRQVCRWGGVLPAEPEIIRNALTWPHPNNVTFIVPGGIAEIFLMRDDVEQVYVKHRKGFVKLALQAGVDLVPVYGLGHTQLFSTLDKSSRLGSLLMWLSRRLQVSLPLAAGRFGMPMVPYKKPVVAIVGKPIRIDTAVPEPTTEQIDAVHAAFVAELRRIFDKHKHLIPSYANKKLYFEDEEVPARPKQINAATADHLFPSTMPSRL